MDALALVEAPDHVCCRYRIRAFESAVCQAGWSLTIEGLERHPFARLAQLRRARAFDTVILQRKLLPRWQFAILRRHARRLVFDFDDAVLYRDSYDPRGPDCPRRAGRFRRIVQNVDGILAGNDFLAECALRYGARPDRIGVLPTCVNTERLPRKLDRGSPAGSLELVWIGSSSTIQGLERERSLLERIGRVFPETRLRLICDRFPRFDPLEVVPLAWSEETEVPDLLGADVGISLIPDDVWSRGKCGLKLLQYRACGLPVIASPVGVHLQMVRPGLDGFLPGTPDGWIEAIGTLRSDPDRRRVMGQAAREATLRGYSIAVWSSAFVAALAGRVPTVPASPVRPRTQVGLTTHDHDAS